jgi:hypothetical protein
MRKIIIVLLLTVAGVSVNGQNLTELFKKELPQYISKYYSAESVNDMLTRDAELNPNILYWRIYYLNELIENKNTNNEKNGFNYIRILTTQSYTEKDNFIKNIKLKSEEGMSSGFRQKIEEFLNIYMANHPINDSQIAIPTPDSNKVNFYIAKYLSGNKDLTYEKDMDYSLLVKNSKIKAVDHIMQKLSELKNIDGVKSYDYFDLYFDKWRIVNENQESFQGISDLVREYIINKYSVKNSGTFEIIAGYSYLFNDSWNKFEMSYSFTDRKDFLVENKSYQTIGLQAVYRFYLKDVISPLSYLNFSLEFTKNTSKSLKVNDVSFSEIYNYFDSYNFSEIYYSAKNIGVGDQNSYYFHLKITSPILIFNPELILEIGFQSGINYYSTDVNYLLNLRNIQYSYSEQLGLSQIWLQNEKNVMKTDKLSKSVFYASPVLQLNYTFLRSIFIEYSLGYNFTGLSAGVRF